MNMQAQEEHTTSNRIGREGATVIKPKELVKKQAIDGREQVCLVKIIVALIC